MEMARVRKGEITFYNLDGDEIEKELKLLTGMQKQQKKLDMSIL